MAPIKSSAIPLLVGFLSPLLGERRLCRPVVVSSGTKIKRAGLVRSSGEAENL